MPKNAPAIALMVLVITSTPASAREPKSVSYLDPWRIWSLWKQVWMNVRLVGGLGYMAPATAILIEKIDHDCNMHI